MHIPNMKEATHKTRYLIYKREILKKNTRSLT